MDALVLANVSPERLSSKPCSFSARGVSQLSLWRLLRRQVFQQLSPVFGEACELAHSDERPDKHFRPDYNKHLQPKHFPGTVTRVFVPRNKCLALYACMKLFMNVSPCGVFHETLGSRPCSSPLKGCFPSLSLVTFVAKAGLQINTLAEGECPSRRFSPASDYYQYLSCKHTFLENAKSS